MVPGQQLAAWTMTMTCCVPTLPVSVLPRQLRVSGSPCCSAVPDVHRAEAATKATEGADETPRKGKRRRVSPGATASPGQVKSPLLPLPACILGCLSLPGTSCSFLLSRTDLSLLTCTLLLAVRLRCRLDSPAVMHTRAWLSWQVLRDQGVTRIKTASPGEGSPHKSQLQLRALHPAG